MPEIDIELYTGTHACADIDANIAEVQNARAGTDGASYHTLKERLDAEESKIVAVPNPSNIYNPENDTIVNATVNKAHIVLNGYTGDLCVSTYGNYAAYFSYLSIKDANGDDMGVSFGSSYIWNAAATRRGVVITVPYGAATMEFSYQHHSSGGGVVVSQIMVTKGNAVPNVYSAYSVKYDFVASDYVKENEINKIIYVSTTGNDNNDGLTPETAVATFSKALTLGHIIRAERGEYYERLSVEHIFGIDIKPYDSPTYSHENPVREKIRIYGPNTSAYRARFEYCDNMHLEDIIFTTSQGSALIIKNCNSCTINNCEASGSTAAMGFEIKNSDVIFNNCYASENHYDGFNFHGYGTTTLNDCVSEDNDDDGCSHHDGCIGTINGGRFSRNGKAGIAPAYGAQVNIYNAVCDDNVLGICYLSTDNGHSAMVGTVNGCLLLGNSDTGLLAQSLCTVTAINCKYSGNTTDKSGIAHEY